MADSIICARHGRTAKVVKGLCGEPRSRWDATTPEGAALRATLGIPDAACGRVPLPECASCKHPAHAGRACSTMGKNSGAGTEWCACAERG